MIVFEQTSRFSLTLLLILTHGLLLSDISLSCLIRKLTSCYSLHLSCYTSSHIHLNVINNENLFLFLRWQCLPMTICFPICCSSSSALEIFSEFIYRRGTFFLHSKHYFNLTAGQAEKAERKRGKFN